MIAGRKHAKEAMLTRKPVMPSKHFIKTYFSSFHEDPVTKVGASNGDAAQGENITVSIRLYIHSYIIYLEILKILNARQIFY